MKALTIIPKENYKTAIMDLEKPTINDNEVLVRVLQAGICRTDLEIYHGLYGEPPPGCDYLIMGHESLGIVEKLGKNVSKCNAYQVGNYVVRTVRRPCIDKCLSCHNEENDMCETGNFMETGIKGLHGIMVEHYKEDPNFLIEVPEVYKHTGVLLEPLSFAVKTVRQAELIKKRMINSKVEKALVLGAGPIGLLTTMVLRCKKIETYTAARTPPGNLKSAIVKEVGAHYLSTTETSLTEHLQKVGNIDLIVEATGSAGVIPEAISLLGTNGVLCLTSITGDDQKIEFPISRFNLDFVLGNKTMVGVVNSNLVDYEEGVSLLRNFEWEWPGVLEKLITKILPLERYEEGFAEDRENIKVVLEL